MSTAIPACSHLSSIVMTTPDHHRCAECLALGWTWVHLRMCLSCGQVGCCDSSRGQHATQHFRSSAHPLVRSIEPGERWVWCYLDDEIVATLPERA